MNIIANFRNPKTDPYLVFLKEKYKDYPITFWYDKFPEKEEQLKINPYNFLFLHEPDEFFGYHTVAKQHYFLFTGILTWNENMLNNTHNSVLFTYNGVTLDNTFINRMNDKEKTFEVSFLCGTKKIVEGHMLRHVVYDIKEQINVPKKWFYVLDDYDHKNNVRPGYDSYNKDLSHIPIGVDVIGYGRRILFEDSMFNVVIENINQKNWYNKIGDNFLSKTIPIYWGCSNIGEFGYDERGIIRFKDQNDLIQILNSLTPELYQQMKPYVDYNYEIALLDYFESKITDFFDNFIKLNNL
jgi:hypothetical protein